MKKGSFSIPDEPFLFFVKFIYLSDTLSELIRSESSDSV